MHCGTAPESVDSAVFPCQDLTVEESSALNIANRPQFRHFFCNSGAIDCLNHFGNVLVSEARFLSKAGHRDCLDENPALLQLSLQLLAADLFLGLCPRHRPPGAMHRGAERVSARLVSPNQQIRSGFHRSTADHRLTGLLKLRRQFTVSGPEGPSRSLPMYDQITLRIPLHLRNVVSNVIDQLHAELLR